MILKSQMVEDYMPIHICRNWFEKNKQVDNLPCFNFFVMHSRYHMMTSK
jgi:hypothetical protein